MVVGGSTRGRQGKRKRLEKMAVDGRVSLAAQTEQLIYAEVKIMCSDRGKGPIHV